MAENKKLNVLLWVARVWGAVVLFFMVFMVGAHFVEAFTNDESSFFGGFDSNEELLTFLFFPIGIMIGLAVAQFKYRLGGYITLIAMIVFLVLRPDLILDSMIYLIGIPGLLFLLHSYLKK